MKGLFQCQYTFIDRKATILLFRREGANKIVERINDFRPYAYVLREAFNKHQHSIITDSVAGFKTIYGDDAVKVFVNKPSDIYTVREFYDSDSFEADVLFDLRYMIDCVDNIETANYKVLYIDIETDVLHGFPDKENPIEPITCVTIYNNFEKVFKTFVWRSDLDNRVTNDIHYFSNEVDMLNSLIDCIRTVNADIITAWNLPFDINYIVARCEKLNVDIQRLSCVRGGVFPPAVRKLEKGEIVILGVVLFDLLRAYKKMHFGELMSYSLNNIAVDELNTEKEDVCNTGDVWRNDLPKLIRYNRKDVSLIVSINNKCKLIKIFDDIKIFSGVRNINDCFFASRIHETAIMHSYRNKLVFPNKKYDNSEDSSINGGFVQQPEAGLYDNVLVFDFKSLYPSLIYTFNLSKEMLCDDGLDIGNGVKFKQTPKGIMPSMIQKLIILKDEFRSKVEGTGQNISDKMFAIKTFINSFYGINALPTFRLYDKRVAESITFLGRSVIQSCSKFIEDNLNLNVVYSDTDSMFVQVPPQLCGLADKGYEIAKLLNSFLVEWLHKRSIAQSNMYIEFEKAFSKIIIQRKKRYAGRVVYEDGVVIDKIKIAGMAARRSDTSPFSKVMQRELISKILHGCSDIQAYDFVFELVNKMNKGEFNVEQIALPIKLNKPIEEYKVRNCPKLRAVRFSNKNLGTQFRAGQKFKMIYVNMVDTDVVAFEDESQLTSIIKFLDVYVMLDKIIFQKVKPLFDVMQWSRLYYDLLSRSKNLVKKQSTLLDSWL